MKKLFALFLLAALACGKRGDPRPPVPMIPKAASDLVVTQRGGKLILAWSYPSLTTAGQNLSDIRRVVVYRYTESLPVPAAGRDANAMLPGDIDPTVPQPIAQFSKVPPITPVQFGKLKERIESIEGANLPTATAGARLVFEDAPAFRSTDGRPVRLTYGVVTEGVAARSDLSNLVSIVPLDVPVPPAALTATPRPAGIELKWQAPERSVAATGKPSLAGYNVYRLRPAELFDESTTPLNPAPLTATTYTDVPPVGDYIYRVTAVAATGMPRIESEASEEVKATFKDLTPPPVPASVTALVEPKAVRLLWDPVEAPDLAGYRIYRTEGVGHDQIREIGTIPLALFPVKTTSYVDTSADLGIAYKYSVSSLDSNGNESARVSTEWVVVPKTP